MLVRALHLDPDSQVQEQSPRRLQVSDCIPGPHRYHFGHQPARGEVLRGKALQAGSESLPIRRAAFNNCTSQGNYSSGRFALPLGAAVAEPVMPGTCFVARAVISQAALEPRLSLAEVSSLTAGRSLEPADVKAGLGAIHLLASHEAASDCYTWIDLRCTFGFKEWCVLLEEQQSVRGGQGPLTGDRQRPSSATNDSSVSASSGPWEGKVRRCASDCISVQSQSRLLKSDEVANGIAAGAAAGAAMTTAKGFDGSTPASAAIPSLSKKDVGALNHEVAHVERRRQEKISCGYTI
ncbi:unnamed protein product [Polarella glacialis]|uniref:Uncharacterized protein n=1 Tax=Polarella glacialis TaxID=89957 RepID=A0A813K8A1_POLGL|nr:unnamed protein product [Polarella glacialis]